MRQAKPPFSPAVHPALTTPPPAALRARLAGWAGLLQLPSTFQGYMVFTFCLLILAFTMVLHVTLSAEIMRLDEQLSGLRGEYEAIERHNASLIYEVARYSELAEVSAKAIAAGYVPADKHKYVVDRPDVAAQLDNPAGADAAEAPQYLVLGGSTAEQVDSAAAPPAASADSADSAAAAGDESAGGVWDWLRPQRLRAGWRAAWNETGAWLHSWLPAWGNP